MIVHGSRVSLTVSVVPSSTGSNSNSTWVGSPSSVHQLHWRRRPGMTSSTVPPYRSPVIRVHGDGATGPSLDRHLSLHPVPDEILVGETLPDGARIDGQGHGPLDHDVAGHIFEELFLHTCNLAVACCVCWCATVGLHKGEGDADTNRHRADEQGESGLTTSTHGCWAIVSCFSAARSTPTRRT